MLSMKHMLMLENCNSIRKKLWNLKEINHINRGSKFPPLRLRCKSYLDQNFSTEASHVLMSISLAHDFVLFFTLMIEIRIMGRERWFNKTEQWLLYKDFFSMINCVFYRVKQVNREKILKNYSTIHYLFENAY